MTAPHLLITWHSRTGTARMLAEAAWQAAGPERARMVAAADATEADFLSAAGYLFVCPENLATISGAMKEMFDRLYYPLLGRIEGRAYATMIAAGTDGSGAQRQIDRIVTGWRLRRVAEPLIARTGADNAEGVLAPKHLSAATCARAAELGEGLAEGLALGLF